jgi:hypothetical protein
LNTASIRLAWSSLTPVPPLVVIGVPMFFVPMFWEA